MIVMVVRMCSCSFFFFLFIYFFFQAEDGIRGRDVTGFRRVLFRSVIFRLMIDLPLTRRIRFWYFVSAFPFTSRYWLLHRSPCPCCLVFPLVSFPFLASGYLCLVPHLHDPGSFSSPYACVSLQLLSRSPLRYLQFVRFIRRGLCVHRRSSLSPISFRISVLPPRFRGSVFVARESRRSALTPLPRSGRSESVV